MRQSPTAFERRLLACLADHQTLSFTELRSAADAPNDRTLMSNIGAVAPVRPHRAPGYSVDAATNELPTA